MKIVNEFKESFKYWQYYKHGKLMAFLDGILFYFLSFLDWIEKKIIREDE